MPSLAGLRGKLRGVYYGWWVLAATFLMGTISNGVFVHSNAIFFRPIRQELGLSSAQASIIFGIARAEAGLSGPIVGPLIDRFGARPLIIVGGMLAGMGFIVLHRVDSYLAFVLVFVLMVSLGRSSGFAQALVSAVNTWFVGRRALAMSIVAAGFSTGGVAILPLVTLGVDTIGWRDVMLYSGLLVLIAAVPLGMVVRRSPESMGIAPEGMEQVTTGAPAGAGASAGVGAAEEFSVGEALRTGTFWVYLAGTVIRVGLWGGLSVHAVEIMFEEGIAPRTAGFMFSFMFFLVIPMRLGMGLLGMRLPVQRLIFMGQWSAALSLVVLLLLDGNLAVFIFIFLWAIEQGTWGLNWTLLGDFFGRKRFSTLMGIMAMAFNLGMLVLPIFAGWVVDRTGSYKLVLVTFAPLYVLGGLLFLVVRKPAPPHRKSLARGVQ